MPMSRTSSSFDGRSSAARDASRDVTGYVLFIAVLTGVAVPSGVSVVPVLTVGGVVVLGRTLDFAIVRFSLPEALTPLFTGSGLMAVCIGGFLLGKSPILVAIAAFAGGWMLHDAIESLRAEGSGIASE